MLSAASNFRPFAVFDELLDCIRVVTRDCSVTEIRINDLLTVLEADYPVSGQPEYVGFTIKGIAHLCKSHDIPAEGPWRIADFLDAIVKASTDDSGPADGTKVVKPIVEEIDRVTQTSWSTFYWSSTHHER